MSLELFEWLILGEAAGDPPQLNQQQQNKKKNNNQPNLPQDNSADDPPDFTATDGNDEQTPNQQDPMTPPSTTPPQEDSTAGAGGGTDPMTLPEEPPSGEEEGTDEEMPPEEGGEEGNPEEMPQDGGETELQAPGDNPQDDLKSAESELFQDLTPDKLAIKTEELKTRYKDLYDSINGSLDKLNKISRTTDDADEIDFLVRKLLDIRDLTRDGLLKAFATKTYVENQIELKRLIYLYSAITNGFTDILHRRIKDQEENQKGKVLKRPKLDPLSGFTKTYDVQ